MQIRYAPAADGVDDEQLEVLEVKRKGDSAAREDRDGLNETTRTGPPRLQRCKRQQQEERVPRHSDRRDLDPEQVAFEIQGIGLGRHYAARLLRDPRAGERAWAAFERLVADIRART